MFLRFDNKLIKEMLLIIVAGLKDTTFDFQAVCANCISAFNEYVFEMAKTTRPNHTVGQVQKFYKEMSDLFTSILADTLFTVFFQENRSLWIFQKTLHTTFAVVCLNGISPQLTEMVVDLVNAHEKDPTRKGKILEKVKNIIEDCPLDSLTIESRQTFAKKYQEIANLADE